MLEKDKALQERRGWVGKGRMSPRHDQLSGTSNLSVSLGPTGRKAVVLGRTLNTLRHIITKNSHNVLSTFMILCWTAFTATPGRMRTTDHRLDSPEREKLLSSLAEWEAGSRILVNRTCTLLSLII